MTGCAVSGAAPRLSAGELHPTNDISASTGLSLIILDFRNGSQDPQADHWGASASDWLSQRLGRVASLRVLPRLAQSFARHRLAKGLGRIDSADSARRVGELVEARRVVWGSYRREASGWRVSFRVLTTATGAATDELMLDANDWLELNQQVATDLLTRLTGQASETESNHSFKPATASPLAWECLSRGQRSTSMSEAESLFRRAIESDPDYADAHVALGRFLLANGKLEAAEASLRRALELDPASAAAHLVLGLALTQPERRLEARTHLEQAMRFDLRDGEAPTRLAELAWERADTAGAILLWEEAKRRSPLDSRLHARLGLAYAQGNQAVRARLELKDAERYSLDDPETEFLLHQAYDVLQDAPASINHGYTYRMLVRRQGGNPARVEPVETRLRQLQRTLSGRPVRAVMPREYTAEALDAALRDRLSPTELGLVVNPLAPTPSMRQIAVTETRAARGDRAKAQRLFELLARRVDSGPGGSLTAAEVFTAWNNPHVSFRCQEYARFYVAMARAAGLHAFFTVVEKDDRGRLVSHACAAVFLDGQAWLADPSYHQFGIQHQGFKVMDDLEAVAAYLHQQGGDLPRLLIAAKLQPGSALAQFNLALVLASNRKFDDARVAMDRGLALERDTWLAQASLGIYLAMLGRASEAEKLLAHALEQNPDNSKARFFLAGLLHSRKLLSEAREQYRAYLRHELEPDAVFREPARRAIAQINEELNGR